MSALQLLKKWPLSISFSFSSSELSGRRRLPSSNDCVLGARGRTKENTLLRNQAPTTSDSSARVCRPCQLWPTYLNHCQDCYFGCLASWTLELKQIFSVPRQWLRLCAFRLFGRRVHLQGKVWRSNRELEIPGRADIKWRTGSLSQLDRDVHDSFDCHAHLIRPVCPTFLSSLIGISQICIADAGLLASSLLTLGTMSFLTGLSHGHKMIC